MKMDRLFWRFGRAVRNYSNLGPSALYITGKEAQYTNVTVTPYIDFDERMASEDLEENLQLRGLNVNLKRVNGLWAMFKVMEEQKTILDVTRKQMSKVISKLMEDEEKYGSEIRELREKAKQVKNDFMNLRDYAAGLEENAASHVLGLPNVLHSKTPKNEEAVAHSYLAKPEGKTKSHIEIAGEQNLMKYISPMFYYLMNDAALFELGVTNFFVDYLRKTNYIPFSNADFARSVVIEGCGTDFNNASQVFTLDDPHDKEKNERCRLHLSGGGSLYSFMAYFTKHSVQESYFPLKAFCHGRIYQPVKDQSVQSLLNLTQYTAVTPFVATLDDDKELDRALGEIQQDVIKLYEGLGYHFRLVYVPPKKLEKTESLRLSIQMMSTYVQDYVEVGHVSVYDSYLSKRLMFVYQVEKERKFPKVLSGTLCNVQKLLACVLENNSLNNVPLLSDTIKSHVTM